MQIKKNYISNLIKHLRKKGDVIYLESQMVNHSASTRSFLAADPIAQIRVFQNSVEIIEKNKSRTFEENPWKALQAFRTDHPDWLFGYFGYDLKNSVEKLESKNPALVSAPDLYFMVPRFLVEIMEDGDIKVLKGELPQSIAEDQTLEKGLDIQLKEQISKEAYMQQIKRAQMDIYEGSYYEINLSHALQYTWKGDSWDLYQAMKNVGPVPFAGYAQIGDLSVCCSSPERYLAREGKRVWSQPIKGTASRKNRDDADKDIERLKSSEKERAENLMIVDLVRNDLSRIARKNSVRVSNLFEVQSFETVHQMVSTIECELNDSMNSLDVIRACFPMGSMTGAPKIASMKAIEGYEDYKRGVYSGALGYMKPNDDFDFNVVIRTALIEGETLVYPVGGAITSDSDPEEEWAETLVKAHAITNIFENIK